MSACWKKPAVLSNGKNLQGVEMAEMLEEFVAVASNTDIREFSRRISGYANKDTQGRIMALFMNTIAKWARLSSDEIDERNEHVVRLAREIIEALGNTYKTEV